MDITKALMISALGMQVPVAELYRPKPVPRPARKARSPAKRRNGEALRALDDDDEDAGAGGGGGVDWEEAERSRIATLEVMAVTQSMLARTIDLLR